jgi:DnaJ-class molecular chaperone
MTKDEKEQKVKSKKPFGGNYKTYDTSEGFGNPDSWKQAFKQRMSSEDAKVIIEKQKLSPWEILGVLKTATQEEIKKAFRKLMMIHHPDKHNNSFESNELSKKILAAYTILKQK